MTNRFVFPPRAPADALARAMADQPGVTVRAVAPRYLAVGPRWVVEAQATTRAAVAAAFRVHGMRTAEWPASEVVLEVHADPAHLAARPPDAVLGREGGPCAMSAPYPARSSGDGWTAVVTSAPPPPGDDEG